MNFAEAYSCVDKASLTWRQAEWHVTFQTMFLLHYLMLGPVSHHKFGPAPWCPDTS